MTKTDTISNAGCGFSESPRSARVRDFGVLILLGLIGITRGRG